MKKTWGFLLAINYLLLLLSIDHKIESFAHPVHLICCAFPSSARPLNLRGVTEFGGPPAAVNQNRRKTPYVGVFERTLRSAGESECHVCSGQTAETTRCPRCTPGQPAIHAVCEEEWLMRHGTCMFCRLPVRKKLESGAHPNDTLWAWRCALVLQAHRNPIFRWTSAQPPSRPANAAPEAPRAHPSSPCSTSPRPRTLIPQSRPRGLGGEQIQGEQGVLAPARCMQGTQGAAETVGQVPPSHPTTPPLRGAPRAAGRRRRRRSMLLRRTKRMAPAAACGAPPPFDQIYCR
jgi:hypothetical protein